jgi:hypothetical protein
MDDQRTISVENLGLYQGRKIITASAATSIIISLLASATEPAHAWIRGVARDSTSTVSELFEVRMGKCIGVAQVVDFTSYGAFVGAAFLAAGDFTAVDNGNQVEFKYTNNEANEVVLHIFILGASNSEY